MNSKKTLYSQYKLMKHLDRIDEWVDGEVSYPIMVDFDFTNSCNNRCPLCIGSKNKDDITVSLEDAKRIILELKELGVRSLGVGGAGEPTCNPNLPEILEFAKQNNIESGIYTNAYELSEEVIDSIIKNCTWMMISLDASNPEIYKKTHGLGGEEFNQVLKNISRLVERRKLLQRDIAIGVCYLLGPHTIEGVYDATKIVKELGVDHIRFRPFLTLAGKKSFKEDSEEMLRLLRKCKELEDDNFKVSYPENRCEAESLQGEIKRKYDKCFVIDFFASITPELKVYPCCFLKDNPDYVLGDLKENSFKEIWNSEQRQEIYDKIKLESCPNPCQFEKHNELLWAIKKNQLNDGVRFIEVLKSVKDEINHENFM